MMERTERIGLIFQPRTVAVLGASEKQQTRGNIVIHNLRDGDFAGRIIPVHPTASHIEGLAAVNNIKDLPADTDVAFLSVPAARVPGSIAELEAHGVGSAVVISNGFASADEQMLRDVLTSAKMAVHGPNCMGVINVTDQIPLYTARIPHKVKAGNVALLAQSGSAAVAVINSLNVGLSKIVTLGSEFQLTSSHYLQWLASDPATTVIGLVVESIQSPAEFAEAARTVRQAGKQLVVLKVGRSATGVLATQAHTGAMIAPNEAYDCYFRDLGIPTASDYDEFVAVLECLSALGETRSQGQLAVVGISGGETALGCDVATELGIPLAKWSETTGDAIRQELIGTTGTNPLDLWAAVNGTPASEFRAAHLIASDPAVGVIALIQDAQASLPEQLVGRYVNSFKLAARLHRETGKPIVMISPTGEPTHPVLSQIVEGSGVPLLRGLRPGLLAVKQLSALPDRGKELTTSGKPAEFDRLAEELKGKSGALPLDLSKRLLAAYGIPTVGSHQFRSSSDPAVDGIATFPIVAKVSSPDIAHRSDVGGVRTGISSREELKQALDAIQSAVRAARPDAKIEGYEIQEDLSGCVEVMVGFTAAPPFGSLTVIGTGGVLVELHGNRSTALGPIGPDEALAMIEQTMPGKVLQGYRNLVPKTGLAPLAALICNLSRLAADFDGLLSECDLNPVMVRPGGGEVRTVDILLVTRPNRPRED